MDERLDKSMKEMICLMEIHTELAFKCFANIPGYLTVDGNDIGPLLKTKDFSSFLHDNLQRIRIDYSTFFSKKAFSGKEAFLNSLDDYSKDLIRLYNHNLFIVCSLIDSLEELIPQKIDKENVECMEVVNTIRKIRKEYNDIDFRYALKYPVKQLLKQIKRISEKKMIKTKDTICLRMNCNSTISFFLQYDEIKTLVIYLYLKVHEFFNDPSHKTEKQLDEIKMMLTKLDAKTSILKSNQEQTKKNTEMSLDNQKTIITQQNEQKQTQDDISKGINETKEFIKKFYEEENSGMLTRRFRAQKIERVINSFLPMYSIEYDSIMKMLRKWDRMLENGETPPVDGYANARKGPPRSFLQWAESSFIFYFKQNHKKGRGKGKKNSLSRRPTYSSSKAAQDEAAKKVYKEQKE